MALISSLLHVCIIIFAFMSPGRGRYRPRGYRGDGTALSPCRQAEAASQLAQTDRTVAAQKAQSQAAPTASLQGVLLSEEAQAAAREFRKQLHQKGRELEVDELCRGYKRAWAELEAEAARLSAERGTGSSSSRSQPARYGCKSCLFSSVGCRECVPWGGEVWPRVFARLAAGESMDAASKPA